MAQVDLEQLSKRFPDGTVAVDQVSLTVADREFLVLVGPSGCGKSTTLRLIAGLEAESGGTIRIAGREVNQVAPKDRDIAMVFQNYALYPHMSVYKNLSFGLTLRYGGGYFARVLRRIFRPRRAVQLAELRSGIDQQVRLTAARLGIEKLLNRKPHQLSGGERQRVALGRAIVRNPAAFLFDEPLSNLDAKLRGQMRVELKRLHRELDATMIYVTHDQIEAMTLGDRVAVMNEGKIQQIGSPLEVYSQPENLFVAQFIGSVPVNLQTGTIEKHDFETSGNEVKTSGKDEGETVFAGPRLTVRLSQLDRNKQEKLAQLGSGKQLTVGFRCENVTIIETIRRDAEVSGAEVCGSENERPENVLTVTAIDRLGESALVYLAEETAGENQSGTDEKSNREHDVSKETNSKETNNKETNDNLTAAMTARVEATTELRPGDQVRIAVDAKHIMWFDPETGRNLLKE